MTSVDVALLAATRATRPEAIAEAARRRRRRPLQGRSDRLLIVAADHPARGALRVRERDLAMADRRDMLERLLVALSRPGVGGVLGTADVLEDLLLLGALEEKIVIGSMNRGGIPGSAFEFDDRFTGYDAASIEAAGFEGGKMLLRIDPADPATVRTLEYCSRAVSELAERHLMAMIEPFWVRREDDGAHNDLDPASMIRAIAISQGLGSTSAYTWLKLPATEQMERVVATSTLPTLLLGGDPAGQQKRTYERWREALRLPTVRGLVVGRALLYPDDDDVAAAVDAAVGLLE